ncbi:hypothetical protein [Kitasatospora sp. NPDC001683]
MENDRLILRLVVPEGVDAAGVGEILTRHDVRFSNVEDLSGEAENVQVDLIGGEEMADRAEAVLRNEFVGSTRSDD